MTMISDAEVIAWGKKKAEEISDAHFIEGVKLFHLATYAEWLSRNILLDSSNVPARFVWDEFGGYIIHEGKIWRSE